MLKGHKCPFCSAIYSKNIRYCSDDGELLRECDLVEENSSVQTAPAQTAANCDEGSIIKNDESADVTKTNTDLLEVRTDLSDITMKEPNHQAEKEHSISNDELPASSQIDFDLILRNSNLGQETNKFERMQSRGQYVQKIHIESLVPIETWNNTEKVDICFMKDGIFERVYLNYQMNVTNLKDFKQLSFEIHLPQGDDHHDTVQNHNLVYYYWFKVRRNGEATYIMEHYPIAAKKLRSLSSRLMNEKFKNFPIFDDVTILPRAYNSNKINEIKQKAIEYYVKSCEIGSTNEHLSNFKIIAMLNNIYSSLCQDDPVYLAHFEKFMTSQFNKQLKSFKKSSPNTQGMNLIQLRIFYCCYVFKFKCFNDGNWLVTLLEANLNSQIDFRNLVNNDFFLSETNVLIEGIQKFFENNNGLMVPHAIYMLMFLYCVLKDKYNDQDQVLFNLNNIHHPDKDVEGLEKYANSLQKMFKIDSNLAVLFINYFSNTNEVNSKQVLESKCLFFTWFVDYLLLVSQKLTNKTRLEEKSMIKIVKILDTLQVRLNEHEKHFTNQNKPNAEMINIDDFLLSYNKIRFIMDTFIQTDARNAAIILKLIKLSLKLFLPIYRLPEYCKTHNKNHPDDEVDILLQSVYNWIRLEWQNSISISFGVKNPKSKTLVIEPSIYQYLTSLKISKLNKDSAHLENKMTRMIEHLLHERIDNSTLDDLLQVRCHFSFDELKDKQTFIRAFFDHDLVYRISNDPSIVVRVFEYLQQNNQLQLFQFIIDQVLERQLHTSDIHFALNNSLFYDLFILNQKTTVLSAKWNDKFQKVLLILKEWLKGVISGNVTIEIVHLVHKNLKQISSLCSLMLNTNDKTLRECVAFRMRQINTIENYRTAMTAFLQICKQFKRIDTTNDYEPKLVALTNDFMKFKLNDLFRPVNVNNQSELKGEPEMKYFENVSKKELDLMNRIIGLDRVKSVLFNYYVNEKCHEGLVGEQRIKLKQVLDSIIPGALKSWALLATQINDGSVKLSMLDFFSERLFANQKNNQLLSELFYICDTNIGNQSDNIKKRKQQLELYFKLKSSLRAAEMIESIRVEYGLTSQFNELNQFLVFTKMKPQEFQTWTLEKMDDNLAATIKILSEMSQHNRIECLRAFVKSKNLVEWLRANTKDIGGFKFLVELILTSKSNDFAQLSVNKNAFAITLKEACVGFASLIYDLKANHDFTAFTKLLRTIWLNLDADPNIAKKLLAVKDQVELLEKIKFKKGNVELSSLSQAKQINKSGIYRIAVQAQKPLTVENLIALEVNLEQEVITDVDAAGKPSIKKNKTTKNFTFEELNELKSMLMLVAKRSTTQDDDAATTDYFIEIFDSIVRLCELYIVLLNEGCVLFDQFSVTVYTDIDDQLMNDDEPLVKVKFNNNNEQQYKRESTLNCLKELCSFLDHVKNNWIDRIKQIRSNYNYINLFTIRQINYLKSTLKKVHIDETFAEDSIDAFQLKALLFNLNEKLTFQFLRAVYVKSLEEIKLKHKKVSSNVGLIQKIATDNNFKVSTVVNAVKMFGITDKSKIIDYCIENDYLTQDDNENEEKTMDVDEANNSDTEGNMDVDVLEHNPARSGFINNLERIFKEFMECERKIKSKTQFTLEHLAIYLETLETMSKLTNQQANVQRKIPGYLVHRGRPNLIMCKLIDQIHIVLSIYSFTAEQPLPSNDEVLYCSPETTSEEVQNFFRIAYKSHGSCIYTILNLHELKYETSMEIEKFLTTNTSLEQSNDYVLVCVCATDSQQQHEQQSSSLIESCLNRYLINPIVMPNESIEKYLSCKFRTNNQSSLGYYDSDNSIVRALVSHKAGNGKSTYVKFFLESLNFKLAYGHKTIRIKSFTIDTDEEFDKLKRVDAKPVVYHIDIANEVFNNVDLFLFNLTILGYLKHSNGQIWRRSSNDIYFIEIMPLYLNRTRSFHSVVNFIPRIEFRTPAAYLYDLKNLERAKLDRLNDNLFNHFFNETRFQRPAIYLRLLKDKPKEVNNYRYSRPLLNDIECLEILLGYSQLKNPNWCELNNFVHFLDEQLHVFENSQVANEMSELRPICLNFIVLMAHDFGLPSLNITGDSDIYTINAQNKIEICMDRLELARRWENNSHPYIIFNADRRTFTFMGIYLDRRTYKFINPNNPGEIIQTSDDYEITAKSRIELLKLQMPIYDNFNDSPRTRKINSLRAVMGLDSRDLINHDPDPTYELTIDNCLKLMAIFMRLRCNHPVILMGETGCGKTRKIKFYSDLHLPPKFKAVKHLIHFKIHGGVTAADIEAKVKRAERLSNVNMSRLYENQSSTKRDANTNEIPASVILFLDEANTTEAIGLIKEIMCDLTCNGRPIDFKHGLKIIAAVNPYRKHSNDMIKKLEEAGLGFYISNKDSKERFGHIPMRQLVYRVQPLPASMLPLVWDFGQLDSKAESVYINQMLEKAFIKNNHHVGIQVAKNDIATLNVLLTQTQEFMRHRRDECSFVSLRDIERAIQVTCWFLEKRHLLFDKMNARRLETDDDDYQTNLSPLYRAFVLALAVCYHASLYNSQTRRDYRQLISSILQIPGVDDEQHDWVMSEILKCQNVFLDEISLANNIARNAALLENVFMIIVCLELRIPLFIVGKPGSSKSLAKYIVESSMNGVNSKMELFRNLKETYFVNFQCSPLTQAEMIKQAFKEAALFQKDRSLQKSVAVVNLDEIGLAEGSESMPLKTLHPLLEDGLMDDSAIDPQNDEHKKVGFIGISNWALDPAKMNRGIFVSRGEPNISELIESAKGICKYDTHIYRSIEPFIDEIAEAYLEVCLKAKQHKREFFGLRDFYSLIKMLYWFCTRDACLTWNKLEHSIRRNFSGLEIDTLEPFRRLLYAKLDQRQLDTDPKCSPIDLIHSALKGENVEANSRYLLLLTENHSIIDMVQGYLINNLNIDANRVNVIFGSNFPNDLKYTEICKNISKIKQSMELGHTVILLNFQNLYESLYDALNQYYYEFAGQKYVYLGINTHRVNCLVNENFRLIIIADKNSVYDSKRFPIPLINRLEKHFLNSSVLLNEYELSLVQKLKQWVDNFAAQSAASHKQPSNSRVNELFVGYHDDLLATIVLYLTHGNFNYLQRMDADQPANLDEESVLSTAQKLLIRCATTDSVVRACSVTNNRMNVSARFDKQALWDEYFNHQRHLSLAELLKLHVNTHDQALNKNLVQVTSHCTHCLTSNELENIAHGAGLKHVDHCLLQSFETQQQFVNKVKTFLNERSTGAAKRCLFVQCDFSKTYEAELLSCVRYTIVEQMNEALKTSTLDDTYVFLIILLARESSNKFIGYQITHWSCYHLDELDPSVHNMPYSLDKLRTKSLSELLVDYQSAPSLQQFMSRLANYSCSLIVDTDINRTIKRVNIFHQLCKNQRFLASFVGRLIRLQQQKENNYRMRDWLSKEVADARTVNERSTLVKSCMHYIEQKLSPLIAFLLARLDSYANFDILADNLAHNNWLCELWLSALESDEFCPLSYDQMRLVENDRNEELREFSSSSAAAAGASSELSTKLPFSWLIVDKLGQLMNHWRESNKNKSLRSSETIQNFLLTISPLFEASSAYRLLQPIASNANATQALDLYLNDFLLLNLNFNTREQLSVVKKLLSRMMSQNNDLRSNLPMVHYNFELVRCKFELYLKFSNFSSRRIDRRMESLDDVTCLELDACLATMDLFERERQNQQLADFNDTRLKIEQLLRMNSHLMSALDDVRLNTPNYNTRLIQITSKSASYKFFRQFMSCVVLKHDTYHSNLRPTLNGIFNDSINSLKFQIIKSPFEFTRKSFVDFMHEFICKLVHNIRVKLFNFDVESTCCHQVRANYRRYLTNNCSCYVCEQCEPASKIGFNNHRAVCMSCRKEIQINRSIFGNLPIGEHDISIQLINIPERKVTFDSLIQNLNEFYVDVIETLVFVGDQKIDEKAVESILKIVVDSAIVYTKGKIELLPKYRGLLIEILFRSHNNVVIEYINNSFKRSDSVMFSSSSQLAIFFQNCIYNYYYSQTLVQKNCNINSDLDVAVSCVNELKASAIKPDQILQAQDKFYNVTNLIYLARLKFCLKILAKLVHSSDQIMQIRDRKLYEHFLSSMKVLFEQTLEKTNTIYFYFIKELIRKYSYSSLKYVISNDEINWMTPTKIIGNNLTIIDRYLLMGETYTKIKKAIDEGILKKNGEQLDKILASSREGIFPFVCVALYMNVTLLYKDIENFSVDYLEKVLEQRFAKYRPHWRKLLQNGEQHYLKVNQENVKHVEMSLLIVQLKYSIMFSNSNLIQPLVTLMQKPLEHKDSFLPCMPQDSLFDIQNAVRQEGIRIGQNPTFYSCPNGHPYVLYNCGQPWVRLKCKDCGADIGGENHVLAGNNRLLNIVDSTAKGYCLPDASSVLNMAANERELNSISFHVLRFFVHACLYIACDENSDAVKDMMSTKPSNKKQFFWNHMDNDLKIVARLLNINQDEMISLLHVICQEVLVKNSNDQSAVIKWTTKDERQKWEKQFNDLFLLSILTNPTAKINECTNKLKKEDNGDITKKEENKKLYFMAYELINNENNQKNNPFIYENDQFWKYQPDVNFEMFKIELNNKTQTHEHRVLKKFVEMENHLQLLKYLPEMVEFVTMIFKNYFKSFFKHFASNNPVSYLLNSKNSSSKTFTKEKLERIVNNFQLVWYNCRQQLNSYIKTHISNVSQLNVAYDFEFTLDSKLSYFLPTIRGDGLVTYSLLHYLCKLQNELLSFYYNFNQLDYENVDFNAITNDFVINYKSTFDLMPLVQSNFTFDSKESNIVFRFDNIMEKMAEKYLQSKPLVNLKTIPFYEYADEISHFNLFSQLDNYVKQELIDQTIQANVFNDFETIDQTAEALNIIKLLISYAKTTTADCEKSINVFMKEIFVDRTNEPYEESLRKNITYNCQLKHLKHLWLILMMKRSFLYTINDMNPFETLNQVFKHEGNVDLKLNLNPLLTLSFSLIIYQLIIFYSNDLTDEEYNLVSKNKISDFLYELDSFNLLNPTSSVEKITDILPVDTQMKSIYCIWLKLADLIKKFN